MGREPLQSADRREREIVPLSSDYPLLKEIIESGILYSKELGNSNGNKTWIYRMKGLILSVQPVVRHPLIALKREFRDRIHG
jgi:hypothetical protein